MQLLRQIRCFVSQLNTAYLMHPEKTAVVFGNTKVRWTYREVINNVQSFVKGLTSQSFVEDDTILVKLPNENIQQKFVIRVAASNLNMKVVSSKAKNMEELKEEIHGCRARGLVFSSYDGLGETTMVDSLYRLIPEMSQAKYNSQISSMEFRFLRCLIQIDNYKLKGTFNYNKMMKYKSEFDYELEFATKQELIPLEDNERPILITDPCSNLAFRAGILNTLINGKLLLCSTPDLAKLASDYYNHKLDIICSEPIDGIHSQCNLYVEAGSRIYEKHPKRRQLTL